MPFHKATLFLSSRLVLVAALLGGLSQLHQIAAAQNPLAQLTFDEMVAQTALDTQEVPEERDQRYFARAELVTQWLAAQNLNQLPADQLLWCAMAIRPYRAGSGAGYAVTWNGLLTVPRDGEYTFSICPLVISAEHDQVYFRQWMTVDVNNQRVVDASPEAWNWNGAPIALSAAQPVPIKVAFRYEKERSSFWRLGAAILYWQGPGFARSVVPAEAFKQPAGDEAGLATEYRWIEPDSTEQVRTIVDPNIDVAWTDAALAGDQSSLTWTATEALFDRITAGEFLAQYGQDGLSTLDGLAHPLFGEGFNQYCRLLTYTTTAQRREIIQRLLAQPQFLASAGVREVVLLHSWIWAGCEREALDLVGTWMLQHTDLQPDFASSIRELNRVNRTWYRSLGVSLTWEYPPGAQWLADDYLEDEQGNCVLPAAYTLSTAYLTRGQIEAWIAFLDQKLDDESLTGDRRVNWLIARARAEEMRHGLQERHYESRERLTAAEPWLQEAILVAESPSAQLRAVMERLVRVAAMQRWDAWNERLQDAQQRFAGNAEALAALAEWQAAAEEAQVKLAAETEEREAASRLAFIAELERRQAAAVARGDTAAGSRYAELILSAQSSAQEP